MLVKLTLALLHHRLLSPVEPESIVDLEEAQHVRAEIADVDSLASHDTTRECVAMLHAHPTDAKIGLLSTCMLFTLCGSGTSALAQGRTLIAARGERAAVRMMRLCLPDAEAQLGGVTLIRMLFHRMSAGDPDSALAAARAGGIEAVLAALAHHPSHEGMHREGVHALDCATTSIHLLQEGGSEGSAELETRRLHAGIIRAVVRSMRAHGRARAVQEHGCHCLAYLASYYDSERASIAQLGGPAAALAAYDAHPRHAATVHASFAALNALCDPPTSKAAYAVYALADLRERVDRALSLHAEHVEVAAVGQSLMSHLDTFATFSAFVAMSVAAPVETLCPGMRVEVVGLTARADLNGREAQVLKWEESRGRWAVRLVGGTEESLLARRDNLVRRGPVFDQV